MATAPTTTTSNPLVVSRTVQPVTRNQEATVYVGNLDERVTEAILWELMLQAGPVVHIHIPRDRISQAHQGYGFVEFQGEADADYASKVMNQVRLHGKPIRVNRATVGANERRAGGGLDVGANLFIGNLAPEVDERMLTDCFGTFGVPILGGPKVARDLENGQSKGYGFVSYDCFESADAAIEAMNGQFLCNRPITVNYAFKKDGRGERHGSMAERMLAAQSRKAVGNTVGIGGAPSPATSAGPWPGAPAMAPLGAYPSQPVYGQMPAYPSSYYPPGYQYYQ